MLIIISQALLLTFVSYWLVNEYKNEEQQLKKELTVELVQANKDVKDSILFRKFIQPSIPGIDSILGNDSISIHNSSISFSPGTHIAIFTEDTLADTPGITSKLMKQRNTTMRISTTLADTMMLDSVKIFPILSSIYKLLTKELIKDSLVKSQFYESFNDSELTKYKFEKVINSKGWNFKAEWNNKDSATNNIHHIYIRLDSNKQMNVMGYSGHLIKQISPQILFSLLLLLTSGFASWLTYTSLRKQIKLSELKNGLISNMSHELKTPVSTVKVALEALDNFDVVNQPYKAREYIHMAMLETHRLELLVNKALNTSLMEQGKMTLQRQKLDIRKLVQEIVDALQLRLQQNNIIIRFHATGNDFTINIDKLHVQGAIMNIIDNSIKYGKEPVEIDINIHAADASITIDIADNGPGIPEQYIDQVFEKFFRVPDGDKHNVKGYGLGLSYVQQVMQLHYGMTRVSNRPEGGCLFSLQFFRGR